MTPYNGILAEFKIVGTCAAKPRPPLLSESERASVREGEEAGGRERERGIARERRRGIERARARARARGRARERERGRQRQWPPKRARASWEFTRYRLAVVACCVGAGN